MLPSSFQKWDQCVSLLFARVPDVGTHTIKAHLTRSRKLVPTFSAVSAGTSRTLLLDTETQLLQATGLVAIDAVLAGSQKPIIQRVEFRTVRSLLLSPTTLGDTMTGMQQKLRRTAS